eukprot:3582940-Pyramimonas_sp.AAC.1
MGAEENIFGPPAGAPQRLPSGARALQRTPNNANQRRGRLRERLDPRQVAHLSEGGPVERPAQR